MGLEDEFSEFIPKAAKTGSPKRSSAPVRQGPGADFSGGFFSDLASRFWQVGKGTQQVLNMTPQIPSALAREFNDILSFLIPQKQVRGFLGKSVPQTGTLSDLVTGKGRGADLEQGEVPSFETTLEKAKKDPAAFLEIPGVRMLPGTFVAREASRGQYQELADNPVLTLLDVLPFLHSATRIATKGSGVAEKAAREAEGMSKPHVAEQLRRQGMSLKQAGGYAGRRAEEAIVKAAPRAHGFMPSQLLEKSTLGGQRTQQTLGLVGTAQRNLERAQAKILDDILKKSDDLGLSTERRIELTRTATSMVRPGYFAKLADNEKSFLRFVHQYNTAFSQMAPEGTFFQYGGEQYLAKGRGRYILKHQKELQKAQVKAEKMLEKYGELDPRTQVAYDAITQANKKLDRAARNAAPARFDPMFRQHGKQAAEEAMRGADTDLGWAQIRQRIDALDFDGLPPAAREAYMAQMKLMRQNWQLIRDQTSPGPVFLSQLGPDEVMRVVDPQFIPRGRKPRAEKERSIMDPAPYVEDLAVGISSQAADILHRHHVEVFTEEMSRRGWLQSREAALEALRPIAERVAKGDAGKYQRTLQRLFQREYRAYDPNSIFAYGKGSLGGSAENKLYLAKGLADTLELLAKPMSQGPGAKALRGANTLFRYSVLYLNPFYYIDNLTSGAVMLMGRGSPTDLRWLPQARRMLKDGKLPPELSIGSRQGTYEEAARVGQRRLGQAFAEDAKKLWLDESGGDIRKAQQRASGFLTGLASSIDDLWKSTAYLAEYNKLNKKGYGHEAAMAGAIEHAHKVLNAMDSMTPWERSTVRTVLPFWSWSKFMLKSIMSYPFDHPYRAAFIARFGEQIRDDWDDRWPERYMGYFFAGKPEKGEQKLYPGRSLMPWVSFGTVAIDPLAGFLSRTDPKIQTILEASGLDLFAGGPELYSEKTYDEFTGRQKVKKPPVLPLLLRNMFPHLEPLFQDEGLDTYYKQHPGRATEATLRSLLGYPVITRNANEEATKAAKARARVGSGGGSVFTSDAGYLDEFS